MNSNSNENFSSGELVRKHPVALTIEDVITFRLQRLVAIGERAGQDWSQRMFDLSLNEWRLLALIKSRSPCRAGDMADLLLMDKSQTSRVIKVLLKKGLIQNLPDPNDGRAVSLTLTKVGEQLHEEMFEEVMKSNERVLATLTREEALALDSILRKLVDHTHSLLEVRLGRKILR